jgi:hypothetical protein
MVGCDAGVERWSKLDIIMITITFEQTKDKKKEQIYEYLHCTITAQKIINKLHFSYRFSVSFRVLFFTWCHLIKVSSFIRIIKDLVRIFRSENLEQTINSIKNPTPIPYAEEKTVRYTKIIGKHSNI